MKDQLLKAVERSRADYTDIRVERTWNTRVLYRGRDLENLETASERGGIVRCLVGGGWGIAVFNDLEELEERVEDAYRIARVVSGEISEGVQLAPVQPLQDEVRVSLEKDPRQVSLQEKQALIRAYNEIMLKYSDKIVTTQSRLIDSFTETTFTNSEGSYIVEEMPNVMLMLMAVARDEKVGIQRGFDDVGAAAGFEAVENQESKAEVAAQRAVDLLAAKPVPGGVYTTILDQELTGVFIHEAFGHLCEADFIFKNPRLREVMSPGRKFGINELNAIEDGYLPGLQGNRKYDDEGTPRRRTYLIKDGILQGFLHNRETAARMGAEPTGNARAVSYRFQPIVRMRNTYIDRGETTFEQMLEGVDYGVYACRSFGGQTAIEQFTFGAAYAYEIVNGRIGEMLRDVVLTGNIFVTLKNIDMIGDDLMIMGSGLGGCGKGGQHPLMTTVGGPHIRIQNQTIGGQAS